MDNITHSLIGAALAQSFSKYTLTKKGLKNPLAVRAAFWTAVVASNIPDLDFVLGPFYGNGTSERKLGYLLSHRGISHSFAFSLVEAGVVTWLIQRILKVKGIKLWFQLYCLAVVSVAVHIFADSWNNYGVHPFFPFWNRWYYGDAIFIVEPWLWLFLGLFVFRKGKIKRWAIGGLCLTFLSFFTGSFFAKREFTKAVEAGQPDIKIVQLATNPAPGNPFCWTGSILSVEDAQYVARKGTLSLFPSLFKSHSCHFITFENSDSEYSDQQSIEGVSWKYEFRRPLNEFLLLEKTNHRFQEFLKYSRIPIWFFKDKTPAYSSDLRYDSPSYTSFTRIGLSPSQSNPSEASVVFGSILEPPTHELFFRGETL